MQQERPSGVDLAQLRQRLGRVGVWSSRLSHESAASAGALVSEIEDLGYGTVWVGETPASKEALVHAGLLLNATRNLMVATGIVNIWGRDATAASNGANALAEAYGNRFVLGLGVSHAPLVSTRGHDYRKPLSAMRDYLDAMDAVHYEGPLSTPAPRMLAALRQGMLELAAERTDGAHPYFVTPEHTAKARTILGPEPVLAPEQTVVLTTDPDRARAVGRAFTTGYLAMPNYYQHMRALGWEERDLADGGSDALVDAIVAWGEPEQVAERIRAHHDAGADHVCVQPLASNAADQLAQLRALAPLLNQG
ncbi:TIGR03620 family F420-dependent LLM class oxidoreductase [Micromonospora sp. NPDC050417]|uniref:TIGR03620 family F420-dependent LLM class oxidoreductase n=1 Tax=Micromonospora sp. NPDC050417 TaxID=3364280 RepID=UPI0037BA6BB7